ncbi:Integrator complex subunit 11 [Irineochytrium annulatum]|nr:Integrator complex subunit 11 [Irineochytrium annulatum]
MSMPLRVVPLGAGQDVGRSCLLLTIGDRNIMLDCGMHMGYNDHRRFPDFDYISKSGEFDKSLDAIIISHFHLDHCGALPYFTEILGFNGPIYMTFPTRAIAAILLDDMRKILMERRGDTNYATSTEIQNCLAKVIPVPLHSTIRVDDELQIKAYYAGHVLGAAMFHIRCGNQSVVYTGDFNMTPDRHLGAAWIDCCRPDVLITESTYATTIRQSKRAREKEFLRQVHECVKNGGKVLVPVFALGRAQELCILIDQYWEQMGIANIPVYYSAGMTERANVYYRMFIGWTNEKIKTTFVERNMFDFKNVKPFDNAWADEPGPMVLFSSPGMLHAGQSLDVFKKWCGNPKNMVVLPGYCVPGTIGARVLAHEKQIDIDGIRYDVNLQVKNLSFSGHADSKGIVELVRMCEPRSVVLVHGEGRKMPALKQKIKQETGIECHDPCNGATVTFGTREAMEVTISRAATSRAFQEAKAKKKPEKPVDEIQRLLMELRGKDVNGKLSLRFSGSVQVEKQPAGGGGVDVGYPRLLDAVEVGEELGLHESKLVMRICVPFDIEKVKRILVQNGVTAVEQDEVRAMRVAVGAIERWLATQKQMGQGIKVRWEGNSVVAGHVRIVPHPTMRMMLLAEWAEFHQQTAVAIVTAMAVDLR